MWSESTENLLTTESGCKNITYIYVEEKIVIKYYLYRISCLLKFHYITKIVYRIVFRVILRNFSYLMPPLLPLGTERKLSLSIKLFCSELCFKRFWANLIFGSPCPHYSMSGKTVFIKYQKWLHRNVFKVILSNFQLWSPKSSSLSYFWVFWSPMSLYRSILEVKESAQTPTTQPDTNSCQNSVALSRWHWKFLDTLFQPYFKFLCRKLWYEFVWLTLWSRVHDMWFRNKF